MNCYICGHEILNGQKSEQRWVQTHLADGHHTDEWKHVNPADHLPTLMGSPMTETVYQVWREQEADKIRMEMLRDVEKALHWPETAMPDSPAEIWQKMLDEITMRASQAEVNRLRDLSAKIERERAAKMVEEWVEGANQPHINILTAEIRACAQRIRSGDVN